ncbi:MAG: prolyl oligopeptidase family serine peptidase, partial [Candidatus Zixiibacteriota bacterium]
DEPEYLSEYDDTDEVGENEREADSGGHAESETVDESDKPKPREVEFRGPFWSDDGQRAFVDAFALDYKDRWLLSLDLESGELTPLERQHDEAWIGGPGIGWLKWPPNVGWLPDNRHIWFKSEESGYSHLYTLNVITGEKKALTSGSFEVSHATLARNKKSWYFISNETHPGERHFYRMPLAGGDPVKITSMTGRNEVYPSPDEKTLAILSSYSNKPWELYVQNNRPGAKSKQLTSSLRDEFAAYPWRDPEIIDFTARDGATVLARLYRPVYPEAQGPAVVFVHGAGYLQNAHKWWSSYYREYMFHNLLADHGYTVLDIDYRASAGYGRDWRAAIYRSMGGRDLSDQVDGARFLVERYDVDSSRIGIYGGSYGGFITFMALFTEPGVFAAGAALRPVTDWAHYNHGYTAAILNIPQKDSIAFVRSSPIYHAEGLEDALLICHGVVDPNVHFQDVVRLIQRLIELGKENWEVAIYPVEGHGFREPSSWTDEYRRVFKLFEENLK